MRTFHSSNFRREMGDGGVKEWLPEIYFLGEDFIGKKKKFNRPLDAVFFLLWSNIRNDVSRSYDSFKATFIEKSGKQKGRDRSRPFLYCIFYFVSVVANPLIMEAASARVVLPPGRRVSSS